MLPDYRTIVRCQGATINDMAVRNPSPPPSGRVERVRLLVWPRHMDALSYQTGTIEGMVGDDVLVRFGEVVGR